MFIDWQIYVKSWKLREPTKPGNDYQKDGQNNKSINKGKPFLVNRRRR